MKLDYEQRQRVEELSTKDAEDLAWKVVELEAQRNQLLKALKIIITLDPDAENSAVFARMAASKAIEEVDDGTQK